MSYRPSPSSLAGRVIDYLTRNPDASLTVNDIVARFVGFGDMRNVHDQLVTACDFDYLEWHPRKDTGGTYCLGPEHPPPRPQDAPLVPSRQRELAPGMAELSRVLPFGRAESPPGPDPTQIAKLRNFASCRPTKKLQADQKAAGGAGA